MVLQIKHITVSSRTLYSLQCGMTIAGADMDDVSSPALQKPSQRQKAAQQALTRYVRYDGKQNQDGKPQAVTQKAPMQTEGSDSLLHVAPVKAGQSIAAALSRQKGKKSQAHHPAQASERQAANDAAFPGKAASQTGTMHPFDEALADLAGCIMWSQLC